MNTKNPLNGLTIYYLGSSVTNGSAAMNVSFVEHIAKRNNTKYYKDAVDGTTLTKVKDGDNSFVSRLEKIDKNIHIDIFVVQLSTNDAMQKITVGSMEYKKPTSVCGAINYIIDYVRKTWNAKVVFYTNPFFYHDYYNRMVVALNTIAKLKKVPVIDLYDDREFNNLTDEKRKIYKADRIHPSSIGYRSWITPRFEADLIKIAERD